MNIPIKIGFNLPSGFREDDLNVKDDNGRQEIGQVS